MLVIGIAGGTGSGKSTVVDKIIRKLPEQSVNLLPQDSYYMDNSGIAPDERKMINFDHPSSIEFELLVQHIKALQAGQPVKQPVYSYIDCIRTGEYVIMKPGDFIIVEGILVFTHKALRDKMDIKVFVEADPDERLLRVIKRDLSERGRTIEEVMERYIKVLKPMHIEFIEPTKKYADIIIPHGGENRKGIDMLVNMIKQLKKHA